METYNLPLFCWGIRYSRYTFCANMTLKLRKHIFWFTFFVGCFFGPSKKKHINLAALCSAENTQLGQDFNLIGNRFSIILFQRPKLELPWKKVFGDEFGSSWVLGFLGRSFFLWLTDLSLSYLLTSFSSGFRSVLGRSRSPGFWQWIKHGSCFGGDPFVDFHIIFYEVLLTSRWNSNSRVNPLTKVAGLHWKYGSRGKFQQKWFLVYWLLQAALDLRKNMEAKNPHRNEGWHILGSTHLHCLGFQNVNFPCFGSARLTPPSSDSSTATSRHEPCTPGS